MLYVIEITPAALRSLEDIADRRTQAAIVRRIDTLTDDPERQGKALRGWLARFLSVRAAGQRYRIVYRVDRTRNRVVIYLVGIRRQGDRRDIYSLAEHLVQRGLL